MHRRINITLPEETLRLIDRLAERGNRSRLIDQALRHYVERRGRSKLKKFLREGAVRRAKRDLRMAEEWLLLDLEA